MRIPSLSIVLALAACAPLAASDVFADFAIPDLLPLAKKHSLMNTGSIKLKSHYDRDLGKLGELKAGSLRLDLSIGKQDDAPMWWDVVNGQDPDHLGYDFTNVDWLDGELTKQGTLPYWGFVYVPVPFQDPRQPAGDWRFLDPDRFNWDRWQEASRTFAGHVRGLHQHGYLEALNEPDLYLPWITGTDTDNLKKGYFLRVPDMDTQLEPTTFQMYVRTAKGFKEGDPDSVVGGPALAGAAMQWTGPFLDYVAGNQAPIDFFSFHVISGDDPFSVVIPRTQGVRDQLAGRGWAHSVEIHMNEYNAYGHPWDQDTDSSDLATHVIENCHDLLGQHDLTVVSWAQAMDNSQVQGAVNGDQTAGLIDWDGNRRRAFTAFAMYGDIPMPSFRSNDDGSIHTMAGADATKAGIIVWNSDGGATTDVTVTAHHIPFATAVFRLVVIDPTGTGNPQGLNPSVLETQAITNPMFRTVHLPPRSVAYLSWTSTAAPALAAPAGQVVRVHHDYPNRATHSWAEYDRRAWTACLGMEDANDLQIVGTTVRDLAATVHVSCRTAGAPASGTLGMRIDYLTGGGYTKSVLFHGGLADGFTVPWGSGRPVDQSVAVALADADIVPGDFAPAGWLGQAVVTYVMNHTGNGTRATFVLSAGGAAGGGTGTGTGTGTGLPPGGSGVGLTGQYFATMDLSGPALTRTDPVIDFTWDTTPPIAGIGLTGYSVRWTGTIQAPTTETYTFHAFSDDGVRLSVDGQRIIDHWVDQPVTESTGTIALTAGHSYAITVEYYQNTGGATARLLWSTPSSPTPAVVPQSRLVPASGGAGGSGTGGGTPAPAVTGANGSGCGSGFAAAVLMLSALSLLRLRVGGGRLPPE